MAKLKYRETQTPTVPSTTTVKGTPLTNLEGDANLKSIDNQLVLLTNNTSITDDLATAVEVYPMWAVAPTAADGTGAVPYRISTTKFRYIPSTNTLICANFQGNASTVTTNADLTGQVTSVGNATTVTNSAVISKVLTGYAAVGTAALPTATSTILNAIVQLAYNDTLTGEVSRTAGSTNSVVSNAAVINKVLTGYTSNTGTLSATDTILSAIEKLNGNVGTKVNATGATLTDATVNVAPTTDDNSLKLANTGYVLGQLATGGFLPVAAGVTAAQGSSLKMARSDHVHADVRPSFRAFINTTNQSVATATMTRVTLNAETHDTANFFDSTTNSRFLPTVAGFYQLNGNLFATSGGTSTEIVVAFYKNGSEYSRNQLTGIAVTSGTLNHSDVIFMNGTTDYVEMWGSNTSSSSPVFAFGTTKTNFSGTLISKG
jgi:hypothetical protein